MGGDARRFFVGGEADFECLVELEVGGGGVEVAEVDVGGWLGKRGGGLGLILIKREGLL